MEQQPPPPPQQQLQKRQRSPQPQQPRVPCARCGSTDTKFCYYNNYNTAQPRHYCRACKRHWTHGGTLRNVPEGGSSKKSKRKPSSSSSSFSAAAAAANVKLPQGHATRDRVAPAVAAGTGHSNDVARSPLHPPQPFFYSGAGGVGLFGEDIIGLPGFASGGVVGDFGRPTPPGFINPLDGVSLQQLVQAPRLSLALHQNLLLLQQQQSWRPPQSNAAPPPFPARTAPPAAATAAVTEEIRNRSNSLFNMSGTAPPPPPPSSFM